MTRHLLKPIRQTKMTLISLIPKGIRIARKLQRIGRKYQRLDINEKFIQKYVPPGYRKTARIITGTLLTGTLIYNIYEELSNIGPIPSKPTSGNINKKYIRNKQYSRRRSQYGSSYSNKYGRRSDTSRNKQCCARIVC